MHYKTFLVLSYITLLAVGFCIPLAVLLNTALIVQSNATDRDEFTHMKAGHRRVEGVVREVKSGLYTVKTATGAIFTLTESAAIRVGHRAPKVGDEHTFWVNEGNMVIDAYPKGHPRKAPRFMTGMLVSIDHGAPKMVLDISKGDTTYHLIPESRMVRDLPVGTEITREVNDRGEIIHLYRARKSTA